MNNGILPSEIEGLVLSNLTNLGQHPDEVWEKLGIGIEYYPSYIAILRKMESKGLLERTKPTSNCNCSGLTLIKLP